MITTGTYTGRSSSPDVRAGRAVTFTGRISRFAQAHDRCDHWHADDPRQCPRYADARIVNGVITERFEVTATSGEQFTTPTARLLANLTMVFDDPALFAAVGLKLETGKNSAIAYPAIPKCR